MAIEKKLICFKTQANFDARLAAGDIREYSIVFIKDTQKIWTHGEYFSSLKEVREALAAKQEKLPIGSENQVLMTTAKGLAWVDLENYGDSELQAKLAALQSDMDTLVKGKNADGVIKTLKEVEDFLAGITDATTLVELLANLKTEILSEFPDLSDYVTFRDLEEKIDDALYESNSLAVEFVDLGLPSGLLWATCNLGAEKETDYGLYFQWGDTVGYQSSCEDWQSNGNSTAHYFDWSTYKYCNGSASTLTKYSSIDSKTVLEAEDDAATAILGTGCRIPTIDDFIELTQYTDPGDGAEYDGWIDDYKGSGVSGLLRKSKINGNVIFFPGVRSYDKNDISPKTEAGLYWSSSLASSKTSSQILYFTISSIRTNTTSYRKCGCTIRAVSSLSKTPKFQPRLPEGEVGQVLTQTSNGVEWSDVSSPDIKEIESSEVSAILEGLYNQYGSGGRGQQVYPGYYGFKCYYNKPIDFDMVYGIYLNNRLVYEGKFYEQSGYYYLNKPTEAYSPYAGESCGVWYRVGDQEMTLYFKYTDYPEAYDRSDNGVMIAKKYY